MTVPGFVGVICVGIWEVVGMTVTIRDWNIRSKWNKITRKTNLSIVIRFNREVAINSLNKVIPYVLIKLAIRPNSTKSVIKHAMILWADYSSFRIENEMNSR